MCDLSSHLEHDHGDGEGVGHGPGEGGCPDCGVTPGADHREVRAVANAWDNQYQGELEGGSWS